MHKRIYLDNAATTPVAAEVVEAMLPYLQNHFGNPSSTHFYGRIAKIAIESARKQISIILGSKPSELYFTSSGTESNNTAITSAIRDLGCGHIITSSIEHHAVLSTVGEHAGCGHCTMSLVQLTENGHIDLGDLELQLKLSPVRCLVTLMHGNNEIGNLLDIEAVGVLCKQYDAIFHSDCVQTVGHYPIALNKLPVHFISASAHKFHGPKGVGLLYIKEGLSAKPFITGGSQERNMRAGTENVAGIVGLKEALMYTMANYEIDSRYIAGLKSAMISQLAEKVEGVSFNGDYNNQSLYTVLNVSFPKNEVTESLLLLLDTNNICASGGSACSSSNQGSHVLQAIGSSNGTISIRFSISRYNTVEEINLVVDKLVQLTNSGMITA